MALIYVKDFPHMADSLKNKKESFLAKEITSQNKHYWVCKCEYEDEDGEISECGKQWNESIESRFHYLHCPDCEKRVEISGYCRFGGTIKRLCIKDNCYVCLMKSYASTPRRLQWSTKNELPPRMIFKGTSAKRIFLDCDCGHTFETNPSDSLRRHACPYCCSPPRKLCNEEDCNECYYGSFQSDDKSRYWNYELNEGITPRQVFRSSNKKYWFTHDCGHTFNKTINAISVQDNFCPFCAGKILCDDVDCEVCYNRSFASCDYSKYWNLEKNGCTPREIFLYCNDEYWFTCDVCKHELYMRVCIVSTGRWCKYCAKQGFCLKEDCKFCFERSFASHKKVKYWLYDKNEVLPRNILKGAKKLCWFRCKYHGDFQSKLREIKRGGWCRVCRHKGEAKLHKFLKELYEDTIFQPSFPWCKSKITKLPLCYDFYIPSFNIIIELDGIQHTKETNFFENSLEDIRNRDVFKMKCAGENNVHMIRIPQPDVYYDKNNWKEKLSDSLREYSNTTFVFISGDNRYDNHVKELEKYFIMD